MSELRKSLRLITTGGALCMVFLACVDSPGFLAFVRDLGGTEFHIGLLGGLPMFMLLFQFFGALLANRLVRRKPSFIVLVIAGRLLYLPIALLPFIMKDTSYAPEIIVVLVALGAALANVSGPSWFAWMADMVPKSILNRYWAGRHRVLQLAWLFAFLATGLFLYETGLDTRRAYLVLASCGVAAGVIDILLFLWVREPQNHVVKGESVIRLLAAPFENRDFRSYLLYQCVWSFVAMFGAAFLQLYALEWLQLGKGRTTLIWCAVIMNALMAPYWGKLADRHGHRSIIAVCTAMKPVIVVMFLFATPGNALWLLPLALFIDSIWNAGHFVANNGYMMKVSPRRNRSVFVASITGLAGICGGLGAIAGGAFMRATAGVHLEWMGREWCNFHFLFAISAVLRSCCTFLAYRIREPESSGHDEVLSEIQRLWPMRYLLFPVGFYRLKVLPALIDAADKVRMNLGDDDSSESDLEAGPRGANK